MILLGSDIESIEAYFSALTEEDEELRTFVLESSPDPDHLERWNEESNRNTYEGPALVLMMPVIEGVDNSFRHLQAIQDVAFVAIFSFDGSNADKVAKKKAAQNVCWRTLKRMRRDAKAGKFYMDGTKYRMAAMEYGQDLAVGYYCVLQITTNTNAQLGLS